MIKILEIKAKLGLIKSLMIHIKKNKIIDISISIKIKILNILNEFLFVEFFF